MPALDTVREVLEANLDSIVHKRLSWRIEAMLSELQFLIEAESRPEMRPRPPLWSIERLQVACVLNAFYQVVVAPLASSLPDSHEHGLGTRIPIQYGRYLSFDPTWNRRITAMLLSYLEMTEAFGLRSAALRAPHAEDMLLVLLEGEEVDDDQ